jgi:hypothetical protein
MFRIRRMLHLLRSQQLLIYQWNTPTTRPKTPRRRFRYAVDPLIIPLGRLARRRQWPHAMEIVIRRRPLAVVVPIVVLRFLVGGREGADEGAEVGERAGYDAVV